MNAGPEEREDPEACAMEGLVDGEEAGRQLLPRRDHIGSILVGPYLLVAAAALAILRNISMKVINDEPQVGQVAVAPVEREAVADEELVRDREPDVAHGQVVDEPPVGAVEERGDVERCRAPQRERAHEVVIVRPVSTTASTRTTSRPSISVFRSFRNRIPSWPVAVARELDEVEGVVDRRRARQVAQERDAGPKRADEQRLTPRVIAAELRADLAHAGTDLVGVEEHLADALVAYRQCAQDAFARPNRTASRSKSRS